MSAIDFEPAWGKYLDYRIDITPYPDRARAWLGDLLLAESDHALLVRETRHVDRLYFPLADVRLALFTQTDHRTTCPFKGHANYWTLIEPNEENVLWAYRTPLPEVGALQGHACFYHDRIRIECEEPWAEARGGCVLAHRFPPWGDQQDLLRLLDVTPDGAGAFLGPARPQPDSRAVVEGGQLMGQAIVAASRTLPAQRVINANITFAKAASWDFPTEVGIEIHRQGKAFSVAGARIMQNGRLCSIAQLLLDSGAPDEFRLVAGMPAVPGPEDCTPLDMGVSGRQLRVLGDAYQHRLSEAGLPEISVWVRFRDDPGEICLRQALIAQATTHWLGAAAMRAIPGWDLSDAHKTFSGAPMALSVSFHDEVDLTDWLLYSNLATYGGRGLTYGEGRVYARNGRLAASFNVQGMMRSFAQDPASAGIKPSHVM